jgi:predicted RNase H-like nuclease
VSKSDDFSYESLTVPPGVLFVAAGEPLLVFPSAAAAENSLAAEEVAEWVDSAAYGPNGEPYGIRCDANRVVIERTGEANRPDELKALLLRHLEACEDPADATQPLAEIVAIAWSIERDFRLRCGPLDNRLGRHISMWSVAGIVLALGALWFFAFR